MAAQQEQLRELSQDVVDVTALAQGLLRRLHDEQSMLQLHGEGDEGHGDVKSLMVEELDNKEREVGHLLACGLRLWVSALTAAPLTPMLCSVIGSC